MQYPARVSPVDHNNLSPRQIHIAAKMGPFGTPDASNLMKTILNYPEFTRAIGRLSSRVTITSELPPRLVQLACMRTVWLCGSEYLWAQHRVTCHQLGITDEELYEVALGPFSKKLTSHDMLIVETIDELHSNHRLSDRKWFAFHQFGLNGPIDIMNNYSFYVIMSVVANSMGVQLDDDLAGFSDDLKALIPKYCNSQG